MFSYTLKIPKDLSNWLEHLSVRVVSVLEMGVEQGNWRLETEEFTGNRFIQTLDLNIKAIKIIFYNRKNPLLNKYSFESKKQIWTTGDIYHYFGSWQEVFHGQTTWKQSHINTISSPWRFIRLIIIFVLWDPRVGKSFNFI